MPGMTGRRLILSLLLLLGLVLGMPARPDQPVRGASSAVAATLEDGAGLPGCCQACLAVEKAKDCMAACSSGICLILPGLMPDMLGRFAMLPRTFLATGQAAAAGRSFSPDLRPPIRRFRA